MLDAVADLAEAGDRAYAEQRQERRSLAEPGRRAGASRQNGRTARNLTPAAESKF